jgi:hypothetical protein
MAGVVKDFDRTYRVRCRLICRTDGHGALELSHGIGIDMRLIARKVMVTYQVVHTRGFRKLEHNRWGM